ncbi:50S ribosomal protein L29 [Chlamydia caviae]|uniref:Large ribosomal subunit protein uL29 n=1 Tax=Chlamydia caviae (strain ATCC VR-813 / DSM 19441 / 03DC25 / GPIC) TaxID=227941 RepID=RL29_CHLCV|nr:50S ribosomal protein L29 [Chlamydia caviae]Q824P3.1 RecName: Full=Large ribosomal subunit protein uL29; AltName: Full=50S ribosomal protein L29 [Chlamydia caviae GPIC]AAP04853.1 ribosomal protein L29 [Chlamydia caviae GPIC]
MAAKKKLLAELREKSLVELDAFIHENKKALFSLRAEAALQNKVVKKHLFSMYKKNIARSMTVMQEKEGKIDG